MKKRGSGHWGPVWKGVLLLAAAAVILWQVTGALDKVDRTQTEEGRRVLEDSLLRAAVTCYANEGIYPPTLEYLTERYGVQIDTKRYAVFYDVFADNMMPDITVITLGPEGGKGP